MSEYKAPLRDISFVMNELLRVEDLYKELPGFEEVSEQILNAVMAECGKFAERELVPLYRSGDEEGADWQDGVVTTPAGFKGAFEKYVENGWPSVSGNPEYGGQGLPYMLASAIQEVFAAANNPWSLYAGLTIGAIKTIEEHGDQRCKSEYLGRLVSGDWTGTMCLTEPHCGSDLSLMRTRAEPEDDGSYSISGTKVFISSGDHDLAENIVHVVLARLPEAPTGTSGLSLFVVPKFTLDEEGEVAQRNTVHCVSIEKKMGFNASATCELHFEKAKGFLVGSPNKGLACMFTFMNAARISTGLAGVAHAEKSYQGALAYARERLAMRSLSGPRNPDGEADPIIVHPDVKRMLLTQKAFTEGGRAMLYFLALQEDVAARGSEDDAKHANDLMELLTPIGKGFLTEVGYEATNHGVQVLGGAGFIRESGMEQIVRDSRILTIWEGTTGIQALDLLGRKVLATGGESLKLFTRMIDELCESDEKGEHSDFLEPLCACKEDWLAITQYAGERAMQNLDEIGAASVDYLMFSGYLCLAYFWARMAIVARAKMTSLDSEQQFYEAKIMTAKFYFDRLLPRSQAHRLALQSGGDSITGMPEELFAL